jgi:phosphoglucomutase
MANMKALMDGLRSDPPAQIAGQPVAVRKDYTDGSVLDLRTGETSAMELSGSNVLRYELTDGTTILVRPSGTEPKVKVYILAQGAHQADCDAKVQKYTAWAQGLKK